MVQPGRVFSIFQIFLLALPALFLCYLIRFWVWFLYPLPTNLLEFTTGVLFLLWLIGIWKFKFPRPNWGNFWQFSAVVLFLLAATLATTKIVLHLEMGRSVPLGIWKGWFIAPALYFLMLISSFRKKGDLQKLLDVTLGSVSLLAGLMVLQYFTGIFSEVMYTYDHRLVWPYIDPLSGKGTSGNYPAIFLAPFLCLGFISFLRSQERFERLWYFACLLVIVTAVYFTKSYGAWLAIIGACSVGGFFLSTGKRRWIGVPLLAILFTAGLYLDQKNTEKFQFALETDELVISSGEERLNIWAVSRDLLQQDPIWGVGPGQFQRSFQQQAPFTLERDVSRKEINHALHPHNTFLMFWLSNGILGVISIFLLILVWILPLPREWRWLILTPLLYYLAHGIIDVFYWKNDLAYSFWFFGALAVLAQQQNILSGKVEHGIKVGRELGFPTANIKLDHDIDKPFGVYIVDLKIEKMKKRGLLYYGPRKTKGLPEEIVCELTVLDFEGDLYGKPLKFKIGKYLRGPKTFDSPEELRRQIEKDVIVARHKKL